MTQPDTNGDEYISYTREPLEQQNMEAVVANTEQGYDTDQAIRHNMYIGWVLALLHTQDIQSIEHKGGNVVTVDMGAFQVDMVLPYPPAEWKP